MDKKLIALAVLLLVCSSIAAWVFMRSQGKTVTTMAPLLPPMPLQPAPVPVPTETPTAITTAPPVPSRPDILLYAPGNPYWSYAPGYYGPRYPVPTVPQYPEAWWPVRPRPIQPGGSWPELMGKDYQDAAAYIMSTYPNMHVAMVRYGAPMPADARPDRFVVVYDAWTRKVVGAQIG